MLGDFSGSEVPASRPKKGHRTTSFCRATTPASLANRENKPSGVRVAGRRVSEDAPCALYMTERRGVELVAGVFGSTLHGLARFPARVLIDSGIRIATAGVFLAVLAARVYPVD